jgi:hypothetical protein
MLTLFSYPELCGVADNNPYGLKVYAFLKLCHVAFRHDHIFDASKAPRGQLPYIVDGDASIGDSDAIISHVIDKYAPGIDDGLTPAQRDTHLLIRRTLDDLYWVMSYSRWKDDRFWPRFRDFFIRAHPVLTVEALESARESISSVTTFRASDATSPPTPTPGGSPISMCLRTCLPAVDTYSAPSPAASMPRSMDLSPTSISMTSIRRSRNFSYQGKILSRIAGRSTPHSDARGLLTRSRKQRPVIPEDHTGGVMAGRAGDAAAGVGAASAVIEAF